MREVLGIFFDVNASQIDCLPSANERGEQPNLKK